MAEQQLQLSQQLIEDIQAAITKHDANANDDMVAVQYMAASIGFLLGHQDMQPAQYKGVMEQLNAIIEHIIQQVRPQPAQPPQQEAFGIWRPGE